MEDVVDFVAEVEDGWWKGKLRGRVGVFPSNFVEMIKNHASNEDAEQTVQDKNKRNEKLKSGKLNHQKCLIRFFRQIKSNFIK